MRKKIKREEALAVEEEEKRGNQHTKAEMRRRMHMGV